MRRGYFSCKPRLDICSAHAFLLYGVRGYAFSAQWHPWAPWLALLQPEHMCHSGWVVDLQPLGTCQSKHSRRVPVVTSFTDSFWAHLVSCPRDLGCHTLRTCDCGNWGKLHRLCHMSLHWVENPWSWSAEHCLVSVCPGIQMSIHNLKEVSASNAASWRTLPKVGTKSRHYGDWTALTAWQMAEMANGSTRWGRVNSRKGQWQWQMAGVSAAEKMAGWGCYFWCFVHLWLYNAPSRVSYLGSSLVRLLYPAEDGKSTLSLISSSAGE